MVSEIVEREEWFVRDPATGNFVRKDPPQQFGFDELKAMLCEKARDKAEIERLQAQVERLSAEKVELERALVKAYGRWTLSCDPNGDFPDWPDDPAGVVNDLWKDGWPAMAGAALGKDASDDRAREEDRG